MQEIEIEISYNTFLGVELSHQYFGEEATEVFKWLPTSETAQLWRKMGLLFRLEKDGWVILNASDLRENFIKILETQSDIKFCFYLYFNNPYFLHYTDLPLESKGKALYLCPQKNDFLHSQESVSEADLLPIRPTYFQINNLAKNAEIALKNESGQLVFQTQTDANGLATLDLKDTPLGRLTLFENNKAKDSFLYTNAPSLSGHRLVAWVEIPITQAMLNNYLKALKAEEPIDYQGFKLNFKARSTYWKYYLIPKYNESLKQTSVETNDNKINFGEPKIETAPNGLSAICFESNVPLLLQKKSPYSFQLFKKKDNKGNNVNLLLRKLPYPSIEMLKPTSREAKAKIYSEMVIYV
ncbi:MAG: hypothetical protein MUE85_00820 [Microscillaceae bacterium]|jgi:hypothetical protein|nr:hypothetical protein [Microscillaceae bacterium]